MKYTGTLTVTDHQVGDTVFLIENDVPVSDTVVRTKNVVDSEDNETVFYQLAGFAYKWFPAAEIFATAGDIKTYFEDLADGL
ncbi:MAG: hypothetical protein IPM96_15920 [Ignavibacteria bacterium]|nr:hypothetical protein [Ignavibacteria bacterium]